MYNYNLVNIQFKNKLVRKASETTKNSKHVTKKFLDNNSELLKYIYSSISIVSSIPKKKKKIYTNL